MAFSVDGRTTRLLAALVTVALCVGLVGAEIHRAKSLNAKPRPHQHSQYQYPLWPPNYGRILSLQPLRGYDDDDGNDTSLGALSSWMREVVWGHETQTWIYSVISASLVGLSGILPLVVIPSEAGNSLRSGAANGRLKLLLSFAVGGLLGDVFLHLLPETWAHLQQLGGDRKGHQKIGFWFLAGLLSFFIIQKIFPESEEEEKKDEDETRQESVILPEEQKKSEFCGSNEKPSAAAAVSIKAKERKRANGKITNAKIGGKHSPKKEPVKNGLCNVMHPQVENVLVDERQRKEGVCVSLGTDDGWVASLKRWVIGSDAEQPQNSHIKTSGWLNLIANMIDNFTHGLAVAGSYSISTKTGLLTTVAILLHEIPHEIGDFAILLRAGFDRWRAAKAQLLTATGGMLGALIALAAESTKEAGESTAWILPFTAGGFIYIALVTVVPDLLKETNPLNSLKQMLFLCAGITTMAAVGMLVD